MSNASSFKSDSNVKMGVSEGDAWNTTGLVMGTSGG